jgi:hypothetical protein
MHSSPPGGGDSGDSVVGLPSSGMPLLVAIDVPPDTLPEYATAVAGSCNAALGEGTCSAGAPDGDGDGDGDGDEPGSQVPPPSSAPTWVAVVRWDDVGYRTLRIELRPGADHPPVETRVVAFTPADPPRQRWASAGLVVAALVSRRETVPRPPPTDLLPTPQPPVEPPAAQPPAPAPVPAPPPPRHPWARIDLGGVAGPGLDAGPARLGGLLRVSVVPAALPLALQVGTRFTARGEQPTVRWLDGSMGITVRLGDWNSTLGGELHCDGVMERMWLTADDPARGVSEVARRWRFGGRLGGEAIWGFAPPAAVFVGAEASLLRPEVIVSIGGDDVGTEPPVRWASSTGLRVSF